MRRTYILQTVIAMFPLLEMHFISREAPASQIAQMVDRGHKNIGSRRRFLNIHYVSNTSYNHYFSSNLQTYHLKKKDREEEVEETISQGTKIQVPHF